MSCAALYSKTKGPFHILLSAVLLVWFLGAFEHGDLSLENAFHSFCSSVVSYPEQKHKVA